MGWWWASGTAGQGDGSSSPWEREEAGITEAAQPFSLLMVKQLIKKTAEFKARPAGGSATITKHTEVKGLSGDSWAETPPQSAAKSEHMEVPKFLGQRLHPALLP